jgi:hypothetical protein
MGLSVSNAGITRVIVARDLIGHTAYSDSLITPQKKKKNLCFRRRNKIIDKRQVDDRRKDRYDHERALCNHPQCKMLSESVKKK